MDDGGSRLAGPELQRPGVPRNCIKVMQSDVNCLTLATVSTLFTRGGSWCRMMIKRRRPECLDLKTDVVVEKVFQEVAVEALTPADVQRVAPVGDRVVARVKEQGERDSLNAARNLGGINAINDKILPFSVV
ncbi:hypothetical protein ES703_64089 [subsurface metagenome]